jgi:ABC-type Fe3+-siderophore transport system permease subunit
LITTLREIISREPKKKILIFILGYFGFVFISFALLLSLKNGLSAEGLQNTFEFSFLIAFFMAPYLAYLELKKERKQ